jgi:hypothetical protein
MSPTTVEVPAGLVAPVRECVVLLYQAAVEALHFVLRAHADRGAPLEEVERQRARVARLDELLGQLGWPAEPEPEGAGDGLRLTAPRDILHDVLYGALIDAGERLAAACGESWRAGAGLEAVRAAAAEVIALDRLLTGLPG